MRQYDYSVKEILTAAFGENTVFEMRRPHESVFDSVEPNMLVPLCWQYADEQAMDLCLDDKYLIDTVLTDDYIAYIMQKRGVRYAYLMFMLTEEDAPFRINIEYAASIFDEWKVKGLEPRILSECIDLEYYPNSTKSFRFIRHLGEGMGSAVYNLQSVNGRKILVFDDHSCWMEYFKKLVSVFQSHQLIEYECLFESEVEITTGTEKERVVLSKGIAAVKELFEENAPIYFGYKEFRDTGVYSLAMLAGGKELTVYVNGRNLISEISPAQEASEDIIPGEAVEQRSLITSIPSLSAVRALDPEKMHSFTIQLSYSDASVRNYYLESFEDRDIPDEITFNGFKLTRTQLRSVSPDANNGVVFDGGSSIAPWRLFYHSYRQLVSEPINSVVYENDDFAVRGVYRTPLIEFKSHFRARLYWGRHDECYGPTRALLDDNGSRLSDASFYSIYNDSPGKSDVFRVCVEPTGKFGFINADGTWLAPPIYTDAEEFDEDCTEVHRIINGKEVKLLLTKSGKEIPFDYTCDTGAFTNDRCAFSAGAFIGKAPSAGYYMDCDWVYPGRWGFINSEGTVVIEPQYVFAAGFYNGGGEHSVVAKMVDGVLRWGVIDLQGNETVPCAYAELYCPWGEAIAFRQEEHGLYGLMDFDGNVIIEPAFDYIEEYDIKHGLVTVGEDEDALGVYSISEQRMIIPCEYECIDYSDRMISCEPINTCNDCYFDCGGNPLDFSEYDRVYERNGMLKVWKDGKAGLIDWDKKVIIPPTVQNGLDFHIDLFNKGLIIVGERKLKGLSTLDGEVILPQIFSEIVLEGDFMVASKRAESNWCINDTLFTLDGSPVLEGLYRNIEVNGTKITAETPYGIEHYTVLKK